MNLLYRHRVSPAFCDNEAPVSSPFLFSSVVLRVGTSFPQSFFLWFQRHHDVHCAHPSIWESASQRRCSISSCTESPASPAGRGRLLRLFLSPHRSFCSVGSSRTTPIAASRKYSIHCLFSVSEKRCCLFLFVYSEISTHNMLDRFQTSLKTLSAIRLSETGCAAAARRRKET